MALKICTLFDKKRLLLESKYLKKKVKEGDGNLGNKSRDPTLKCYILHFAFQCIPTAGYALNYESFYKLMN
jgi:hypothetical protein